MAGGLMQIVAYGAQDIYLTGNPQITFFKVVYRRHTNFAIESIEQTFNGTSDFGKKVSCTISRNGDLIHRIFLETTIPEVSLSSFAASLRVAHWVHYLGERLIDYVEISIGGVKIDRHYGEWLHLWNQLSLPAAQEYAYQRMIGNIPELTRNYRSTIPGLSGSTIPGKRLYIPLQFWFCRNPGLALPLIALQYHEVKIDIQFQQLNKLFLLVTGTPGSTYSSIDTLTGVSLGETSLWVDYVFLDNDERRRFAQVAHEYLIEQVQFQGEEPINSTLSKVRLPFNHPVKELVWVVQRGVADDFLQWTNYTTKLDSSPHQTYNSSGSHLLYGLLEDMSGAYLRAAVDSGENNCINAKIQLNGQDRFATRTGDYFNYVQPYNHHTRSPHVGINVYSFALKPEEHQPSGTCNFSRIDNANLLITVGNDTNSGSTIQIESGSNRLVDSGYSGTRYARIRVYAVNYNVLRITSGMGGIAYSN
jgi:hypothetical protein